jgi:hypothetical protein
LSSDRPLPLEDLKFLSRRSSLIAIAIARHFESVILLFVPISDRVQILIQIDLLARVRRLEYVSCDCNVLI